MFMIKDFDEMLEKVREQYHYMEERVSEAQRAVREFRKDEEIADANARADYFASHSLHTFSDKERESDRAFREKHYEMHKSHTKASGNTYIYTLTGTGIGTCITVKCPICGEEEDITDFDNW